MISMRMFTLLAAVVALVLPLAAQCGTPTPPAAEEPTAPSIGDLVWYDADHDGIHDAPEAGVPDVRVELYASDDTLAASTTTDEDGSYLFRGVGPGDYYVKFTLPTAYLFTQEDQGDDDSVDSDADRTTGKTILIALDAGETALTWDAGMYEFVPTPPPPPTPTPVPTATPEEDAETPEPGAVECNVDADCPYGECINEVCAVPCDDDLDCFVFESCAEEGVCIPLACDLDIDCPYGECIENLCHPSLCEDDADCPYGECIENLCHPSLCEDDADCPYGECINEVCVPLPCDHDADCGEGVCEGGVCVECLQNLDCCNAHPREVWRCWSGVCVESECDYPDDCEDICPGRWVCHEHVCIPSRCRDDDDCPYGECINEVCAPWPCDDDADCGEGVCEDGVCVECLQNLDCCKAHPGQVWQCYSGVCVEYDCALPGDCEDICPGAWMCREDVCVPLPCHDDADCGANERCESGQCVASEPPAPEPTVPPAGVTVTGSAPIGGWPEVWLGKLLDGAAALEEYFGPVCVPECPDEATGVFHDLVAEFFVAPIDQQTGEYVFHEVGPGRYIVLYDFWTRDDGSFAGYVGSFPFIISETSPPTVDVGPLVKVTICE